MSKARRSQVIAPDVLDGLVARSDVAGLRALAVHLLSLGLLGAGAVALSPVPAAVCWCGYAVVLIFVFCPLHETIHETAFASPRLNRCVAFVFGMVLFLPPRFFRAFHMAHHRHTQLPGNDPELGMAKPGTRWGYVRHVSGLPYWISQGRMFWRYATGHVDDFVPASRHRELVSEARQFLLIYAALAALSVVFGTAALWWYWLLPVLVAQPLLRMFLLAEHTGCPEVPDMFDNTRTTLTNPLFQRLCWNMNFHTAHHAYAGIPFHRLPEVNRLVSGHLVHVGQGYFRVNREIYHTLGGYPAIAETGGSR